MNSFSLNADFDFAEICRGLKYTASASIAYWGDCKGLISNKVISEPKMRSGIVNYLIKEILDSAK